MNWPLVAARVIRKPIFIKLCEPRSSAMTTEGDGRFRAQQDAEQIYQIFAFPSLMSAMAAVTDKFSVGRNEPNSA
jgi:hypothetical protein